MVLKKGKSRFITLSLLILALTRFAIVEIGPKFIPAGILMISSCADERPPTGGKRDSIPPKMKSADPPNKSLNFKSEKVNIRFSEFIQQTLDPKEILISPPMDKKPKIAVNGKNLTINFKSKLKENTTYTINFGDAIKDINEGNILKNFSYVFATGPMLDTASISGSVTNIASPTELNDINISLYPADSVDGILRSKPFYFAKTDKAGLFMINNIHSGTYRVYGLKDVNLNYIYDQPDELIGFMDTMITLMDSSKSKIALNVFLSVNNKPKFIDAISPGAGRVLLTYNSPIKKIIVTSDMPSGKEVVEVNSRKDSITYWYSNIYMKKASFTIVANDSIRDTVRMDLKTFNKDSMNNAKKYSLSFESQSFKTDSSGKSTYIKPILSPFKPLILNLSRPVDSINQNKALVIVNDSTSKTDTVAYILSPKTKRKITIDYPQIEKTSYTLIVPDSAFLDLFGWWNKKFLYKWNSDANENYGNIILSLKFEHPEKQYVVKLLDQDNKAVETFTFTGETEKKVLIKNIKTGPYHLQAIDDTNNNGEWDSGDFSKKLQPEKIINFRETYEVKGNWDLEIEVKL
jgi:hypothetical protein